MNRAPVRLADVARAAGVHPSVVSRVLNDDPSLSVRPATAQRIRQEAERSGYRPNAVARALRGASTGALGMVVPLLRNPIWTAVQAGALQRAEELGFVVMITEERVEQGRPVGDFSYLVQQHRVDGLMFATSLRTHRVRDSRPDVPHVFINRRGVRPGNDVIMDEAGAVQLVVDHVAGLGHTRLMMLDGLKDIDTVWRRAAAARALAAERGLSLDVVHTVQDEQHGYAVAERIVASSRRPSVCLVGSITQLVGLLAGLRRGGVAVPAEVSVVCFDEDDLLAFLDVPVTSVAMPLAELGMAGVDALVSRIRSGGTGDLVVDSPMTLVGRDSVADRRPLEHTATRPSGQGRRVSR